MKLHELSGRDGSRKARKRIGRGIGSGKGKTGGRGGKGQTARSGVRIKGFEGGQMPLHRRLPKRGFNNIFALEFAEVNLDRLQQAIDAKQLDAGAVINAESLVKSGVLRRPKDGVRLLGRGEIKTKVALSVWGASKSAVGAVEKAGGSVALLAPAAADDPKKGPRLDAQGDALPDGAVARFGSVRLRHGGEVYLLSFTPDSKAVVSLAGDQTFRRAATVRGESWCLSASKVARTTL